MDAIECIKTRRSVRSFHDKDVPVEIVDDILDCARKAPSANNSQSWSFVVVWDQKKRDLLSQAQPWAGFISQAPVCIVVCCDKNYTTHMPGKYLNSAVAAENIMLAAHAHGLGTCWCYVKDFDDSSVEDKVKDVLSIPEDIEVLCMIPAGYPSSKPGDRTLKEMDEIVHKEEW